MNTCEHKQSGPHDTDEGSYYAPEIGYCPGPPADVDTGYGQSVFWKDGTGVIRLITDMDNRYRVNCCRFLIDKAADRYARMRYRQEMVNWWNYLAAGDAAWARGSWGPVDPSEEPTAEELFRLIRKELDKGMHLDWMRSTALFQRMALGLEDRVGPGVFSC